VDEADNRADNPYTALEGYRAYDAQGAQVGEVDDTVYDAPSDVLKYLIVDGRTVLADGMEVDAEEGRIYLPYDRATIESAPAFEGLSGAFDTALREHYGQSG
jgi:sporulation protein YlmC with PRC-barrel domain